MKASNALSTLRVVTIAFGMIVAFGIPTFGQEAPLQNEASAPKPAPAMNEVLRHNIENWALQGRGVPQDWSHHHLVFSNPGTEEAAIANGTHDRWLSIVNDPRYILQQMKRSSGVKTLADPEIASLETAAETASTKKGKRTKIKKDWSQPLLAGQVQPNMYPAKFSFSSTVASCSTDFVVYPTGVAGAGGAASLVAYSNLYSGCGGTVPSVNWAYNTGGTVTTSPIISEGGLQVAFIQSSPTTQTQTVTGCTVSYVFLNFFLIDLTCTGGGLTQADVGAVVSGNSNIPAGDTIATVTGATTATLTTAATATFSSPATLTLTYSANTASLVLLKWAPSPTPPAGVKGTFLNASTTVIITTGTVTSADVGMQISGAGIPANDTIVSVTGPSVTLAAATTAASSGAETLTITAETVTTPGAAPTVSNANYRSCTAPCMTTVAFANGQNDTFSAPFYDFESDDAIYVGDDNGYLHQFTGVFAGTPAETVTTWPVQVNATAGTKVSSPVYDDTSGYVFVGDSTGVLHAVGTGNAGTTNGSKHGTSSDLGDTIIDGTLVDPTAKTVYAFVTSNSNTDNAVYQFSTNFTSGHGNGAATGTQTGTGGAGYYFYSGTFDNVYYESSSGTSPSGNLYVIGGTGATTGAILYQIPITSNAMAATANSAVTTLNTAQPPWPSPLTEFCNAGAGECALNVGGTATTTGTDYLFFSIYHSNKGGCTAAHGNGCILSYNISNPAAVAISGTGLNVPAEGNPGCWVTSGIEIDNSSTTTGASQIYFVNLNGNGAGGPTSGTYTSGNCGGNSVANTIQAVQASQASP